MASIRIPAHMVDPDNRKMPFASSEVFKRHVETAAQNAYTSSDVYPLTAENQQLAGSLYAMPALTGGDSDDEESPTDGDSPAYSAETDSAQHVKRRATREIVIGIMARMRNQHVLSFPMLCLCVLMYTDGVGESSWGWLSCVLMLFTKAWTEDFLAAVAVVVAVDPPDTNTNVRLAVFDNLSFMLRTVHQRAKGNGFMLHIVMWLSVPLSNVRFPTNLLPGEWYRKDASKWSVRRMFSPRNPAFGRLRTDTWCLFMSAASRKIDILAHPDVPAPERTFFVVEAPVLDVGTAKNADVDLVLGAIKRRFIYCLIVIMAPMRSGARMARRAAGAAVALASATVQPARAALVLVVGDQQSYWRVLHLKLRNRTRYR